MNNPLVSIVLPTWNRAYTLRNAIVSILDQTYTNWELIVIDDGSKDLTSGLMRDYDIPKIRYENLGEHVGLIEALRIGNEMAKGDIIIKQDSDDISFPDRLEVITNEMKDADFFYHSLYKAFQDPDDPTVIHRELIPALPMEERILKHDYIPGAFAYTPDFIKSVPYRNLICSEDWMIKIDAFMKKKKIRFSERALYDLLLRPDSNSVVNQNNKRYLKDAETMKKIMEEEYGIKDFRYGF